MTAIGNGLGYAKLTVPEDGLSQSLQFWGAEAGKRKAAADLANERAGVRKADAEAKKVEKLDSDIKASKYDFTSKDAGYANLTENYSAFSRDAANSFNELRAKWLEHRKSGNQIEAAKTEDLMERVKTSFKEQQGAAEKFKGIYDQYAKMDMEGKLSDYDKGKWKTIKGFMKGDTKNVFLTYDKETNMGQWVSREIGEDGQEVINKLGISDLDNGRVAPLEKIELLGDKGLVANYTDLMGTFEKDWYSQGKDRSTKGYNEFAEGKLSEALANDLDDNEVKDLSAQMFGKNSGLEDPKTMAEYKAKVVNELKDRVMMGEKIKESSKLNLSQAELDEKIRANRARENRPVAKKAGSKQDELLGIRKKNIGDVKETNNVEDFSSGDFKWGGKEYVSVGANVVGNNIVISAKGKNSSDIKKIVVEKADAPLNELYNAFENSKWTMDKVQLVEPVKWRDLEPKNKSRITDIVNEGFDENGKFDSGWGAGDANFRDRILELYPNAEVTNNYFRDGDISVNGKPIQLQGKTKAEIDAQLEDALGKEQFQDAEVSDPRATYGMETTRNGKTYIFNTSTGTYQLK